MITFHRKEVTMERVNDQIVVRTENGADCHIVFGLRIRLEYDRKVIAPFCQFLIQGFDRIMKLGTLLFV